MEDLTFAVGNELSKRWPDLIIYHENQASGFETPSLYVHRVNLSIVPGNIGDRQMRTYQYQVIYFPPEDSDKANSLMATMAEQAASWLITIGEKYRLHNVDIHQEDNTLQINFDLQIMAAFVDISAKQQEMDYTGGLTDGK